MMTACSTPCRKTTGMCSFDAKNCFSMDFLNIIKKYLRKKRTKNKLKTLDYKAH